jgi:hypothetical protein
MALSKLIYAFLSITSLSTIYLLSENKKMCDEVDHLRDQTCAEVHNMNTERIDRMAEKVMFLEGVSEQMWVKRK